MRTLPLLAATALLALLVACGPDAPVAPLPTDPTEAPAFASDAEALAAAEEAYAAYLAMSDLISSEGGVHPERIAPFVTEAWLPHEIDSADQLALAGIRIVGHSRFTAIELQYVDAIGAVVYICHDSSDTRVLDATGADVTPSDRPVEGRLQVTFERSEQQLLIAGSELWSQSC